MCLEVAVKLIVNTQCCRYIASIGRTFLTSGVDFKYIRTELRNSAQL